MINDLQPDKNRMVVVSIDDVQCLLEFIDNLSKRVKVESLEEVLEIGGKGLAVWRDLAERVAKYNATE